MIYYNIYEKMNVFINNYNTELKETQNDKEKNIIQTKGMHNLIKKLFIEKNKLIRNNKEYKKSFKEISDKIKNGNMI